MTAPSDLSPSLMPRDGLDEVPYVLLGTFGRALAVFLVALFLLLRCLALARAIKERIKSHPRINHAGFVGRSNTDFSLTVRKTDKLGAVLRYCNGNRPIPYLIFSETAGP